MKIIKLILILLLTSGVVLPAVNKEYKVVPGELIIKLASNTGYLSRGIRSTGIFEIDNVLSQYQITDIAPVVPFKKRNIKLPDVNRIYRVKFSDDLDPRVICSDLSTKPDVLYAEPRYIYEKTTTPNDPGFSDQWHLPTIDAESAWNITQGDTNVIIAIVDDAIDINHEDLKQNIFINWAEYHGSTGVDDDENGFVDDINGWDFAENNNNPIPVLDSQAHGTHVSGCASAVTDNGVGVSAPGWKCKILPLKISNDTDGTLTGDAAAAIIYAADMGAAVTNNSYGGGGFSNYFRDAFLYAYGKGTLSLASAGNGNNDSAQYPASYKHVVSVASTAPGDIRSDFSTYHLAVDISSPGTAILSSVPGNEYAYYSGTSMSGPVAAGVAALIKSQFPSLTAHDLSVRLGGSADNIYDINPDYYLKLGAGRVNANNAVNLSDDQLVQFPTRLDLISYFISDTAYGNSDYIYDFGETIQISLELYNYSVLGSEDIDLTLTSENEFLTIQNSNSSDLTVGYEDYLNVSNAFSVEISDSADVGNTKLKLNIYQDGEFLLSHPINMNIGTAPILVVDDDNNMLDSPETELFYTTVLDSLGISYLLHDRSTGPLTTDQLSASPIVIWFTEWAFPTLDEDDRNALSAYLDRGGNLYISGQDLGWEMNYYGDGAGFYSEYLHAIWGGDHSGSFQVKGIPGNPISEGLNFDVYQPGYDLSYQYPDFFTVAEDADLIFEYDNGLSMGLSYGGDYRLVYTGVGLETFGSTAGSVAPDDVNMIQETFMERTLDFLNFINHAPLLDTEDTTSAIGFHVKLFNDGEGMTTPVLNYKFGDSDYIIRQMTDTLNGFSFWAPAPDSTVIVEYYFTVSSEYYNWTNPINIDEPFMFNMGRDLIPPRLSNLTPLPSRIDRSGQDEVSVFAMDNIAVEKVMLNWYYSSTPDQVETIDMVFDGNKWIGSVSYENLPGREKVYYFASAVDSSSNANMGYSDTLHYTIINTTTLTTWDYDEVGEDWDTGDSWGLMYINEVIGNGMNDSPSTTYENNKADTLTLLSPFQISDYNKAYLQFWNGSFLRDGDYGTVEISGDMINWTEVYSITGMNATGSVTIGVTEFIETGVGIRFIIQTDGSGVSSGWYVDDIQLLVDTTIDLSTTDGVTLPKEYVLHQNYPNPFNPITTIHFDIPVESRINLTIFNLLGRRVKSFTMESVVPGSHEIIWNGEDDFGRSVSSGVYLYRLQSTSVKVGSSDTFIKTRKMVLLK